jgi:hypothetical protein
MIFEYARYERHPICLNYSVTATVQYEPMLLAWQVMCRQFIPDLD